MNRQEIRDRSRFLIADELAYALARDDRVNTDAIRERATMRLARDVAEPEVYELCRGMIDAVARNVERDFVVDFNTQQLGFGKALRVDDNALCPVERATMRDWIAFDEIRERAYQNHKAKRDHERDRVAEIIERLESHGDEARTLEVCPDLFESFGGEAAQA